MPIVEWALGALIVEGVLLSVAITAGLFSKRGLVERLGLGPGTLRVGRCAWLVVGTLALSLGLDGCIDLWGLSEGGTLEEFARNMQGVSGFELLAMMVALGVAPGIAEEALCRGLLQRGLVPRFGQAGAVLIAAICFGALHLDAVHAAFAVPLGLYLGIGASRANSIRPAIFCHTANNLLAVYAAARWSEVPSLGGLGTALALATALVCLGAALRVQKPAFGLQNSDETVDV